MEIEDEGRPLLTARARHPKRSRFEKCCLGISTEFAITGIIVLIFIIIVVLLIVFQFLFSSTLTKWDQVTEVSLLGSSQLRAVGNSSIREEVKKPSMENEEKNKDKKVNRRTEGASTASGLVSPPLYMTTESNYNSMDLDSEWKEKGSFAPTDLDRKQGKAEVSWKTFFPNDILHDFLFKFGHKNLDKTWREQNHEYMPDDIDQQRGNVDKTWMKKSHDTINVSYEHKEIDEGRDDSRIAGDKEWDRANQGRNENTVKHLLRRKNKGMGKTLLDICMETQDLLEPQSASNSINWDQIHDGWKKFLQQGVAVPSMCPLVYSEIMQRPPIPQDTIDCALMAEEMRKTLGRCVDLSFLPKKCKPRQRVKCFATDKYRNADGTCNNRKHPFWGQSGTPFVRMAEPHYSDGVSAIRKAKNGGTLPNARKLSRKLYSKRLKPDGNTTALFVVFGLLVDHDVIQTGIDSNGIQCCNELYEWYPHLRPRECLQIEIPEDDPFYGPRNVRCLNLLRSAPVFGECMGRREQLNRATSFLDASVIYGATEQRMTSLRSFYKGQLESQRINNASFMPSSDSSSYKCGTPREPLKCFVGGDSRTNMLVELTALTTLWHREHNRIAKTLHKLNPRWTEATLFHQARRILIAELQHIVYNEFLTLLLGDEALEEYELKINPNQAYEGYDDTINPSVYNVFGAAAFRFGHSLVQDELMLCGFGYSEEGQVPLHETYFNPQLLYHNGLDLLIRGAVLKSSHSVDSYITPEVRDHLFQPAGLDYGHDLSAVSIQRGRDHGLPGYIRWREVCGLPSVEDWDDLYDIMDAKRADNLKEAYASIDDIDLIPGALAEHHAKGALIGPTYLCIIGRQFMKIRKGDRFWFENRNQHGSFTEDQLNEIYKSSAARIICDNSDNIQSVQKYPFQMPSESNPIISCKEISSVDLSKWKE